MLQQQPCAFHMVAWHNPCLLEDRGTPEPRNYSAVPATWSCTYPRRSRKRFQHTVLKCLLSLLPFPLFHNHHTQPKVRNKNKNQKSHFRQYLDLSILSESSHATKLSRSYLEDFQFITKVSESLFAPGLWIQFYIKVKGPLTFPLLNVLNSKLELNLYVHDFICISMLRTLVRVCIFSCLCILTWSNQSSICPNTRKYLVNSSSECSHHNQMWTHHERKEARFWARKPLLRT